MIIILETTKRTSRIVDGHFSAKKQNFLEMYHKLGHFERNLAQKNDRIVGPDCNMQIYFVFIALSIEF